MAYEARVEKDDWKMDSAMQYLPVSWPPDFVCKPNQLPTHFTPCTTKQGRGRGLSAGEALRGVWFGESQKVAGGVAAIAK